MSGNGLQIPTNISFRSGHPHGEAKGSGVLIPTDDPDTVRVAAAAVDTDSAYDPAFDIHRGPGDWDADIVSGTEEIASFGNENGVASGVVEVEAEAGDQIFLEPDAYHGNWRSDYGGVTVTESDLEPGDPIEAFPADYDLSGIPDIYGKASSTPPANATEGIVEALLSVPGISVPEGTEPSDPPEDNSDERQRTRQALRDDLDETLEAEGYDPDRWNTDARSDGTLILQDPETDRTRTIEPDVGESGIDSAVESLDSSSDSSTGDSDSTGGEQDSSPGGGVDGLGQVGGIMLLAAIATAVYYGVTQT